MTGLTFVECHYDWRTLNLPYLNLIGLLNVPAETSLGILKLGGVLSDSPVDSSIVNINTGDNGKARPNDFNTVTVTIQDGGVIREVDSNIRWIQDKQSISSSNIYTPEEALSQFLSHNAKLSLTIPAGEGSFSYPNIYQNDKAQAKEAVISDYVLSYLEKPQTSTQKFLTPFYTIRGTATLTTGYRVRFVQTVPALKDASYSSDFITGNTSAKPNQSIASNLNKFSLKELLSLPAEALREGGTLLNSQAYAQQDETVHSNLQLKTFLLPTSTPFPGQAGSSGSGSSGELASDAGNYKCLSEDGSTMGEKIKLNVPGYGEVALKVTYGTGFKSLNLDNIMSAHTFFYAEGAVSLSKIQKIKDSFFQQVQEQYVIDVAKHLTSDNKGLVTTSSTVDDIKASFPKINKIPVACSPYMYVDHPAPVFNCPDTFEGAPFRKDIAEQTANIVAQQIYNAVQQNQLESLASKQDLFLQTTIGQLQWVNVDVAESENRDGESCYISGVSPYLFLYSPKTQSVSITLPNFLTYTDPETTNGNIWNIKALSNGTFQTTSGQSFPYLYYEYNKAKVTLSQPNTGFSIPYDQWETTVRNTIAAKLNLTQPETERLVLEVKNALLQLPKSSYLTLSLVPEEEINAKLPLSISPVPDILHRIQILITPTGQQQTIPAPVLTTLSRSGFTATEIGARGK